VPNFYKWQKHGSSEKKTSTPQNRYRLMWMDVKYEPNGKVVAFDDNGKAVAERRHVLRKPYQIVLDRPKNNHRQW
jgi:beta-galactosidase